MFIMFIIALFIRQKLKTTQIPSTCAQLNGDSAVKTNTLNDLIHSKEIMLMKKTNLKCLYPSHSQDCTLLRDRGKRVTILRPTRTTQLDSASKLLRINAHFSTVKNKKPILIMLLFIQPSQNHKTIETENRLVIYRGHGLESRLERQKGDGYDYKAIVQILPVECRYKYYL